MTDALPPPHSAPSRPHQPACGSFFLQHAAGELGLSTRGHAVHVAVLGAEQRRT